MYVPAQIINYIESSSLLCFVQEAAVDGYASHVIFVNRMLNRMLQQNNWTYSLFGLLFKVRIVRA